MAADVQRELAEIGLEQRQYDALLPLIADAEKRAAAAASCPTCVREGGPYRCCPHCVDDPDFHKAGVRNHHDLPCTLCLRFPEATR